MSELKQVKQVKQAKQPQSKQPETKQPETKQPKPAKPAAEQAKAAEASKPASKQEPAQKKQKVAALFVSVVCTCVLPFLCSDWWFLMLMACLPTLSIQLAESAAPAAGVTKLPNGLQWVDEVWFVFWLAVYVRLSPLFLLRFVFGWLDLVGCVWVWVVGVV